MFICFLSKQIGTGMLSYILLVLGLLFNMIVVIVVTIVLISIIVIFITIIIALLPLSLSLLSVCNTTIYYYIMDAFSMYISICVGYL